MKMFAQTAANTWTFAIPLHLLFPELASIPNRTLYSGMGQKIKMNLRICSPDVLIPAAEDRPTFTMSNLHVLKVYSKLDPAINDLVLKSRFTLPASKFIWYGA